MVTGFRCLPSCSFRAGQAFVCRQFPEVATRSCNLGPRLGSATMFLNPCQPQQRLDRAPLSLLTHHASAGCPWRQPCPMTPVTDRAA